MERMFQTMRTDLDVCVCNPLTDKFTTYEILIKTRNPAFTLHQSHTRRRFNDFCWLKKLLKSHHPLCVCPELPAKKRSNRFEPQFIVQRMGELENWIKSVVEMSLYISDTAVHLFLQTNLSCRQIDLYLEGKLSESIVQRAYQAAAFQDDSVSGRPPNSDDSSTPMQCPMMQACPVMQAHSKVSFHEEQSEDSKRTDSGIAETESDFEFTSSGTSSPRSSLSNSLDSANCSGRFPALTEVLVHTPCENGNQNPCNSNCQCKDSEPVQSESRNIKNESRQIKSETESETESETQPKSPVKVQMGVIFSVN